MGFYKCKVIDDLGQKKVFIKEANDKISLHATLKREGYVLRSSTLIKEKKGNSFFAVSSKVKKADVVSFIREFAIMIKASIPVSDAINVLRKQKKSTVFKNVLTDIYHDINSGLSLSVAFSKHPKIFPNYFVNMVAIGEESGSLDRVLESMADYYENDIKIKRKAKSAMVYPSVLGVLIIVVILFMSLFVLPQFEKTISELGGEIPVLTRVVMSISGFIVDYIYIIIPVLLVLILSLYLFFHKTNTGKLIKDKLIFNLPIIKTVERNLITARFTRAFIILLSSGMTITDCMENLKKMLDNKMFEKKFEYSIEEVKRGKRIARSIENTNIFPLMLTEMINVGEKSGDLEGVLKSINSYFDSCVESSIQKATAALEPIMIIVLGVVVGLVILAVFLPIISMMQNIGGI